MSKLAITGYQPGAIGRITELHANYYYANWGFHLYFEAKVATDMAEFLQRFDHDQDLYAVAWLGGQIVGSIAIDAVQAEEQGAHLRWFIISETAQGQGIGNLLLNKVIEYCRVKQYKRIYLWTFAGLDGARHLYEKYGFALCLEREDNQWGKAVTEQMFELLLD